MLQHAFVWDAAQVQRFEALVYTPESFADGGCHVINLSVRAKYDTAGALKLNGRQGMHIEHRIIDAPGKLLRSILKYNVPVEAFVDDAGNPIPPSCMSVYSTLDNRSSMDGMKELSNEFQLHVYEKARHPNAKLPAFDARRRLISAVSRSPMSRRFCQVDIDVKEPSLVAAVAHQLRAWAVKPTFTIETHGGYHIVIQYKDIPPRHQRDIRRIFDIVPGAKRAADNKLLVEFLNSAALIPVPGTRQGGFSVSFVDLP